MAASPDGRWVYVTCEGTGAVEVIDTATTKMVKELAVGGRPRAAAFLPDASKAYVTSETGGTVTVIALPDHDDHQDHEDRGTAHGHRRRPPTARWPT